MIVSHYPSSRGPRHLDITYQYSMLLPSSSLLARSTCNSIYASRFRVPTLIPFSPFKTMKHFASKSPIPTDAKVAEFQQVLHSDPSHPNHWDNCWDKGLTPWDLGAPTPLLVHLHKIGSLPKGRALIPGCGTGYDVVEIACAERHVVGVDISHNAIRKAAELSSGSPNADHFTFLEADFFTWHPSELFDLIFDYTFFCAIEPELRPLWARKIHHLLKPEGELITLMFPIDDHEGGPPYRVSVADYEEVLHGVGIKAILIADNELAVAPRKGREKIGRWKRGICRSMV